MSYTSLLSYHTSFLDLVFSVLTFSRLVVHGGVVLVPDPNVKGPPGPTGRRLSRRPFMPPYAVSRRTPSCLRRLRPLFPFLPGRFLFKELRSFPAISRDLVFPSDQAGFLSSTPHPKGMSGSNPFLSDLKRAVFAFLVASYRAGPWGVLRCDVLRSAGY